MKHCGNCDIVKPLYEFSKCSSRKDGLQTQCKTCQNARRQLHYLDNRESTLLRNAARRVAAIKARGGYKGQRGENNNNWRGEQVSYEGAHRRVQRSRGSARLHSCVDCGGRAQEWSYDRGCPNEKPSRLGAYSIDTDRYQARCVSCHRVFDGSINNVATR